MKTEIRSREFVRKMNELSEDEKTDIGKAVNRVLTDPENDSFKRHYLTPYKQEHPTNKQITIFFETLSEQEKVFFVWINDYSCLHDTRKSFGEDPCLVKFKKLQLSGQLETYRSDYHEGALKITPRQSDPHFLRFSAIDIKTYTNILNDGETYYCMSLTTEDNKSEDNFNLFIHHLRLFLKVIRKHFKENQQNFELRIPRHFNDEIIDHLNAAYDPSDWNEDSDEDLFVLKMRP